jgi:hypothetical protein
MIKPGGIIFIAIIHANLLAYQEFISFHIFLGTSRAENPVRAENSPCNRPGYYCHINIMQINAN